MSSIENMEGNRRTTGSDAVGSNVELDRRPTFVDPNRRLHQQSQTQSGVTLLAKSRCFTNYRYVLCLFGDDPVRPLDKRHKNRGIAELCSPLGQVRFRHTPGAAASPASVNLNVFGDYLIKSLN